MLHLFLFDMQVQDLQHALGIQEEVLAIAQILALVV